MTIKKKRKKEQRDEGMEDFDISLTTNRKRTQV
jgi:hypothetical protein